MRIKLSALRSIIKESAQRALSTETVHELDPARRKRPVEPKRLGAPVGSVKDIRSAPKGITYIGGEGDWCRVLVKPMIDDGSLSRCPGATEYDLSDDELRARRDGRTIAVWSEFMPRDELEAEEDGGAWLSGRWIMDLDDDNKDPYGDL